MSKAGCARSGMSGGGKGSVGNMRRVDKGGKGVYMWNGRGRRRGKGDMSCGEKRTMLCGVARGYVKWPKNGQVYLV